MISELQALLEVVFSAVVLFLGTKAYLDHKESKDELRFLREKEIARSIEDEKQKIHKKFDDKSLDELVDSSPTIYGKLGPPKDN